MSLPLKRRMARVALLVAAAAPVIGLGATSASAVALPEATGLGGLSSMDSAANLGGSADAATHNAVGMVGDAGGSAAKTLVPTTSQTLGGASQSITPVAGKAVGDATGQVGQVAGQAAKAGGGQGLTGGGLPSL